MAYSSIFIFNFVVAQSNKLSYLEFYSRFNRENLDQENTQSSPLILDFLPSDLQQSAQNDNVKIFCVDGSKFSSPENPCVDIYIELLNQDCLPASNGLPQSMNALKAYWRLDLPELSAGKRPVMVFYHSRNAVHGFDDNFLSTLSTFGGMICIVTDQPSYGIQQFSPNQPNLTAAILKWIDRTLQES